MSDAAFNVFHENCPSRRLLEIISDKWVVLIISKLADKTYRFGELRREIGGISQKVLTQTLKELEKNGLISRIAYPVLPMKVEYSLTDLGKSISSILTALTNWAEQHMPAINLARQQYENTA